MYRVLKVLRRILLFFFILIFSFVLVFVSSKPKETKAVVPAIAIGGAIIASFLAAAGVSLTATNIANSSDMNETLNDLANQYSSASGASSIDTELAVKNAYNLYYNDKAGEAIVSVSERFSAWLYNFKNWFVNNFALTDSGDTIIINDSFIQGMNGEKFIYYNDLSVLQGGVPLSLTSVIPDSVHLYQLNADTTFRLTFGAVYYQYYYNWINVTVERLNANEQVVGSIYHNYRLTNESAYSFIRCFFYNNNSSLAFRISPTDSGVYTSGYDLGTNISINSLDINSIGLTGSLTDGYSDFEQALTDAQSDAGADGQIVINVGEVEAEKPYTQEGIADSILNKSIANTAEGVLVGGYADEKEVEEETDSERLPTGAEIGEGIVVVNGLEDFFPFCIPFDLYEVINVFDAPAVCPHFTVEVPFTGVVAKPVELEVDLTPYENVANIFRILLIIGFLLILIFKTRDLIRG